MFTLALTFLESYSRQYFIKPPLSIHNQLKSSRKHRSFCSFETPRNVVHQLRTSLSNFFFFFKLNSTPERRSLREIPVALINSRCVRWNRVLVGEARQLSFWKLWSSWPRKRCPSSEAVHLMGNEEWCMRQRVVVGCRWQCYFECVSVAAHGHLLGCSRASVVLQHAPCLAARFVQILITWPPDTMVTAVTVAVSSVSVCHTE